MNKYYVIEDKPDGWCNTQPRGFDTIKEAEDFIREDSLEWLEGAQHELGTFDDWCSPYYIVEVKAIRQPVIKVQASVTLKKVAK